MPEDPEELEGRDTGKEQDEQEGEGEQEDPGPWEEQDGCRLDGEPWTQAVRGTDRGREEPTPREDQDVGEEHKDRGEQNTEEAQEE